MKRFWLFGLCMTLLAAVLTGPVKVHAEDDMDSVNEAMGGLAIRVGKVEDALKFKFKADIRFRGENFIRDDDANGLGTKHQYRTRVRARLSASKKVSDEVGGYLGIATGSMTDPTSTNQTLDDDATFKGVILNLAAVEYSPAALGHKVKLIGGKMKNPLDKTAITWDGDVTPEGIGIKVNEGGQTSFNFLYFILEENSAKSEPYIVAAQLKQAFKAGDADCTFLIGGEVFPEPSNGSIYATPWKAFTANGMVVDASMGGTIPDIAVVEGMLTIKHKVQKVPFAWTFHAAYNTNSFEINPTTVPGVTEEAGNALALLAKVGIGKAAPGSWAGGLEFGMIEPNAVVGLFSDSDSGPGYNNNTWVKGNVKVGLAKDLTFSVTHYLDWRTNYEVLSAQSQAPLHRTQIDTIVAL